MGENYAQEAITIIRETIKKRLVDLRRFEAMSERINNLTLLAANRGGIEELNLLLEHLPEEKK